MRRSAALCALMLVGGGCAAPPRPAADPLAAALASLLGNPDLAGGRVGVCVLDGGNGALVIEAAADRGFATASNMKLVTAAVALATLGPEHTASTELWACGEVREGVLHGDLVLRGHGDPSFGVGEAGRAQLEALVAAVRERGIARVAGRIVGDGSWLGRESLGLGWQWDYLDADYAAPFGALCCAGNVVAIRVAPGGDGPTVVVEPPWYPVRVRIESVPAGSATRIAAARALGAEAIDVAGTLAPDARPQTLRVAVPDPAAFAAGHLAAALRAAGIDSGGAELASDGTPGTLLASVPSLPLGTLVRPLLLQSDNLIAEVVGRSAARIAIGDGSTTGLARHALQQLEQLGVDTDGMVIADASGLSRRNLVQPRQLARLLLAMRGSPHCEVFEAALPVGGASGTLRARFSDGPARGRVRAKTGFIARVVCLSGYMPRADGREPLVFSIMLNDFTCSDAAARAAVDAFVQQLAVAAGW
jgi:D-alanyl-D-alanine carboxypeptidase/D-alanyl-D-alanine-endopeptidase (penicillin-binding protein 4)